MSTTASSELEQATSDAPETPVRSTILSDLLAGATGAVAGAPQAMGFAIIAGINPVYGLYTAVVATIVGALTSSSTFMTIAPTNAVALVVGSTLVHFDEATQIERLFVLTVLVGIIQLAFGLLRFGNLTRFVSNAVMTGFITGAGMLIILGQLTHLTGYDSDANGVLPRLFDFITHLDHGDMHTFWIGILTMALILGFKRTRLKESGILIALIITGMIVAILDWQSVAIVRDISEISAGLPHPVLPSFSYVPDLVVPAFAVAILALVQSAALTLAVPEPDGSTADVNQDFVGQGIANLASGFLQGMPSGGSLSRTAINISSGAKTRNANIFAGIMIGLALLVFGSLAEKVVLAALAGHLIIAAATLIRVNTIKTVWKVNRTARLSMIVTFLATLTLPLEYSIYIGVGLSLLLYVHSSAVKLHVARLVPIGNNQFKVASVPATLPSHQALILSVSGNLYFAAVGTLKDLLPSAQNSLHSVVILRLRDNQYLGSTGLRLLKEYGDTLQATGGKLILSGISPQIRAELTRTGAINQLGEKNIFFADEVMFSSTQSALSYADEWLREGS